MENKLSKADRTRQHIIETTSAIFNIRGYAGTSLSDLTEASGLTKGGIYCNFSNKEEIALAAFDYNFDMVFSQIYKKVSEAATGYDKIMAYVRVYEQLSRKGAPQGGCPILNTSVDADDTNSLLKSRAAKAVNKWKKELQEILQAGILEGEFKTDFDITQMALSIIALIEGGVMISKVTNSQVNLDKILKTVRILLDGIKV
jgi:AcrR family transcriptional regulator